MQEKGGKGKCPKKTRPAGRTANRRGSNNAIRCWISEMPCPDTVVIRDVTQSSRGMRELYLAKEPKETDRNGRRPLPYLNLDVQPGPEPPVACRTAAPPGAGALSRSRRPRIWGHCRGAKETLLVSGSTEALPDSWPPHTPGTSVAPGWRSRLSVLVSVDLGLARVSMA